MYLIIILIVICIILGNNLSEKNKEIKRLNNQLMNKPNFCPYCGKSVCIDVQHYNQSYNIYNNYTSYNNNYVNYNNNYIQNNYVNNNVTKKMDPKDAKNTMILTIGALMIILAAIILLVTSWNIMGNGIKTIILFSMLFMFIGASYIAKSKFKLEMTSKVFLYLGMTYLPICLFSLSALNILGEEYSLLGDKCLIYYSLSSLIVGIVYYLLTIKEKRSLLFFLSSMFINLAIILFGIYYTINVKIILSIILGLQLILDMLKENEKFVRYKEITTVLTILYIVLVLQVNVFTSPLDDISLLTFIPFTILLVYLIISKLGYKDILIKILSGVLVLYVGLYINCKMETILLLQLLMCLYYIALLIIDCILDKKIKLSSFIIISISNVLLLSSLSFDASLDPYAYILIYSLISLTTYLINKNEYYLLIAFYSFLLSVITLIIHYELSILLPLSVSLLTYILSSIKDKKIININSLVTTSYIFVMMIDVSLIISIILLVVFALIILYNYLNKNQIVSYIYLNAIIFKILTLFNIDNYIIYLFFSSMLVLSSLYNYSYKNKFYEFFIYVPLYIIINKLLLDLDIAIVSVYLIPNYLLSILFINRFVNSKDKSADYCLYSFIIFLSLLFEQVFDGIIIITFFCILLAVGYIKKDNALLYCNGVGAVIFTFVITKDFWIALPWWIYLLVIGSSLIGFGIYNEMKKK